MAPNEIRGEPGLAAPNSHTSPSRGWLWLWILSALAALALAVPTAMKLVEFHTARKAGDMPKALAAARSVSDGFFGPLLEPWIESEVKEVREEVIEGNLMSIKRLVPDSEESAYAEMELGRLALGQGNYTQAAIHLERYLKSGLGRDVARAKMDLSEAYKELKKFEDSADLLRQVIRNTPTRDERMEASFRLGELYQFFLNRPANALEIYRSAVEDTIASAKWRNDILTNLSLMKE